MECWDFCSESPSTLFIFLNVFISLNWKPDPCAQTVSHSITVWPTRVFPQLPNLKTHISHILSLPCLCVCSAPQTATVLNQTVDIEVSRAGVSSRHAHHTSGRVALMYLMHRYFSSSQQSPRLLCYFFISFFQRSVLSTPVGKGAGLNVTIDIEVSPLLWCFDPNRLY